MLEAGIDEAKRMANKITTITLATGVFLGCAVIKTPVVNSAPTLLEPTPYLSFNDSPFKNVSFSYFYLEDFEDGSLNVPGVTASSASGLPVIVAGPNFYRDSVDIDDGVIDGNGQQGHTLYEQGNGTIGGIKFTFNANTLGNLPTHVGIVWTDSYSSFGGIDQTPLTFQGFDAQGNSLGTIALGQGQIGDTRNDGTTVDDRFFGVINLAGISAISISQTLINVGFDVDHLQYGSVAKSSQTVSEPSVIFGLLGFGLFGLGAICKRTVSANWM
ncbi:MAG: hypothetical protein GPJ10_09460 [Microcystis aeruginosa L211-07]|nr:hypothetical protein [Microcystis aeruginosa L211-07]